jgi:hypothetical protein
MMGEMGGSREISSDDDQPVIDPRRDAAERVGGLYDVRVLEPAPPAVNEAPWFADDPVNAGPAESRQPILAPVPIPEAEFTWDTYARPVRELADWCADRWLGAWRPLVAPSDLDALARTRASWHTLAEHVVAPARHRANGKIGLRYTHRGFGTPFFGADEQVRLTPDGIVVVRDGVAVVHPVTTVADAARVVGIEPGAPKDVYTPVTALEPDARLVVEPEAGRFLSDWFGFGASVLEELRAVAAVTDTPARVQIWPEHFDLSVDAGVEDTGSRATYGASPGDDRHPTPYLYVSPWRPQSGSFWNEGTFVSLGLDALLAADDQRRAALEFFDRAKATLTS